jgi:hypothetical protein
MKKVLRFLWKAAIAVPIWFWEKTRSRNSYEKALDTLAAIEEEYALSPWLVTLYMNSVTWEGDGIQEREWLVVVGYDPELYSDELEAKLNSYPARVTTKPQKRAVALSRNHS